MAAGRDRGWGCTVDDGWAWDNPQRDAQGDGWRPVGLPAVAQPACQGQDGQAQVCCCSCLNCTLCKSLSAKLLLFARNGGLAFAICGCRCGWLHSHWVSSHPHGNCRQMPCANAMVKPSEFHFFCSAAHNLSLMHVHAAGLVWCQMNVHSLHSQILVWLLNILCSIFASKGL